MSLPFDQQVTLSPKNLIPNFNWTDGLDFDWGLSLPFVQQVKLSPKTKNPIPNFDWELSLPFDQQATLSPKNLITNFDWGGCLYLLISK